MSISKVAKPRKSATLVAAQATVSIPMPEAPAINPPAVVVELLPPAPNTLKDSDSAKPVLHVDQAIVDAFLQAEGEAKQAAVMLFRACVARSVAPAQFVGRSDAKVRASEFNCAWRVGALFGHDNARRIIDAAADQAGDKRDNVLKALRKAKEYGEQIKKTALKGAELNKALKRAGDEAVEFAEEAQNFAKVPKGRGAQDHRIPKSDSMEAYAPIALAALGDLLKNLGTIKIKPRQLAHVTTLKGALEEAVEVLERLTRKD